MIGVWFLCLICPGWAAATTRTVTDLGDNGAPGQLRTLMNSAVSGDTIIIPVGTITVAGAQNEDANAGGDLDVLKNLIIQGAGAGTTIIDGGANDGVFDILVGHTLTLSGVTIRNGVNSAQAGGGGIRNFGTLNLSDAIVSGNEAARTTAGIRTNGGGIRNLATMNLTNVVVTGNLARGDGGGIYNEQGSVMTLTDVTVSGNTVEIDGGGIYNLGTATLTRVTVSGNNADTAAGGIFTGGAVVTAATATLTNVTVSGNHVNSFGGGIYNTATAILTNVTVSDNAANFSGGGIANFGSTTLKNVIVARNSGVVVPGTANCSISSAITSLGHNLDSGTGCGLTSTGDLSNTDPLLGPLQDNGGFAFTHALLAGSPAIDAGTNVGCPATDQRGFARDAFCDIGAYESNAPTQTATATTVNSNAVTFSSSSQQVTLAAAVSALGGRIVNEGTVTFQVMDGGINVGTAIHSATLTDGNAIVSYALPIKTGAKTYTIEASYSGGTNFLASSGTGTLTVNKAQSTTTFTSTAPATLVKDQTYTPTATSTGDGTLTIGASGSCSITGGVVTITDTQGTCTVTATESDGNNFLGSSATAQTITVLADFSFPTNPSAITISAPGGSGTTTLNITSQPGFSGTINFSCTGLPAKSSCSFSPPAAGTVTITVATTAPLVTMLQGAPSLNWWTTGGGVTLAAVFLAGLPGKRRRWTVLLGLLVTGLLLTVVGCGGGTTHNTIPGTPPGAFTVTVTGASGPLTHSTTFTLNVQ
jgi:Bacterial Ig-like domain (group 3)